MSDKKELSQNNKKMTKKLDTEPSKEEQKRGLFQNIIRPYMFGFVEKNERLMNWFSVNLIILYKFTLNYCIFYRPRTKK